MKTHISYLVIALLMINALSGQVKIGGNPQTLNPASVLELESTSRVLVITRVNDLQMNAINPLRGALVYNTDHDCLHYYNGAEWINICEALDNSFTVSTLAMANEHPDAKDDTVVITQTENPDGSINYNFEVNQIGNPNIENFSISGDKIRNSVVDSQHLAPESVQFTKFELGTSPGQLIQWDGFTWVKISEADINVTEKQDLEDVIALDPSAGNQNIKNLLNPADPDDAATKDYVDTEILASNQTIVSADANNSITASGTDGGAFYDDSTIQTNVADNTADIATNTANITTNQTNIAQNTADIADITVVSGDTNNSITASGADGGAFYDDSAIQSDIADNAADIAANTTAIGTKENSANKSSDVTLSDGTNTLFPTELAVKTYVDTEIAASNQTIVSGDANNSIIASGADGGAFYDDSVIQSDIADNAADITTNATAIGTKENSANKSSDVTLSDGTNTLFPTELAVKTYVDTEVSGINTLANGNIYVGDLANTAQEVAINGDVIMDNAGLVTIQPDVVTTTEIGTAGLTDADRVLTTDAAGDPQWEDRANFASSNLIAGQILVGDATNTATGVTMNGDATMDNTGLVTIQPNAVTTNEIGTDGLTDANKVLATDAAGDPIWQTPAVVAMGKVDALLAGANTKINGAIVTRPSTGNYTVTFVTPRPDANYIIQLTLLGAALGSSIQAQNQTSAGFDVVIVSTEPSFIPTSAGIQIIDTSPEVADHTHTGVTDPIIIVDNLIFPQVNASWYFTITDF